MPVELLPDAVAAGLARQQLTYSGVGRSMSGPPPGYHFFARTRQLPAEMGFDRIGADLMRWQVQARSGLRVAASSLEVEPNAVVLMRFGLGPFSVRIPCRVVTVIDDVERCGFAYGTLPGHPESGEEAFVLERQPDGTTHFTVTAFSRPASPLARLGGPITPHVQRWMTGRYLRALE